MFKIENYIGGVRRREKHLAAAEYRPEQSDAEQSEPDRTGLYR